VKFTWLRLLAGLLLAGLPLQALTDSEQEQARRQLQQLQGDIARINREITSASVRRDKLQRQLRDADKELGRIQREIADNRREMAAGRQQLSELQDERKTLQTARGDQQGRIAHELRRAWQMGRQGQLRVLLSQESPHTVARAMGYYRYFFEARNALLTQYRETLARLETVEDRIDSTLAELEQRQETLEEQQAGLARAQQQRKLAVAELNASIDSKGARLQQLEKDRKELESLLQALEEAVANLQVPENYQAFKAARGNMPWPVKGKPSNRFGRPRNEGKMRWQGVTIPAPEGTTVRAIHHGRVVYADWFRGSGLLLILDHGDGYMSLYAHNQSLLRDVGEWVTAGTPISTVGTSGGQDQASLYFEIRHQGKPTDPSGWCRG
jgi:septal ring factor EnvC (AmiA/AmiB activator)